MRAKDSLSVGFGTVAIVVLDTQGHRVRDSSSMALPLVLVHRCSDVLWIPGELMLVDLFLPNHFSGPQPLPFPIGPWV